MDWPVLVDSLNLLQVDAVPITVAIDEHGIVRHKGLRLDAVEEFRSGFVQADFPPPADALPAQTPPDRWPVPERPAADAAAASWSRYAHQLLLGVDPSHLDAAAEAYHWALELAPDDGWTLFRVGVALRRRYDSEHRRPGDFQAAVDAWKQALDTDPNQYIWRRRIQQYGPRLDKPYPFYDWVARAREEIRARGEEPAPLVVEPGGAELADPQAELTHAAGPAEEPDPNDRIHRDSGELIRVETIAAPSTVAPGEALRAHVVFRPRTEVEAHWNNEAEGLETWMEAPAGCRLDGPAQSLAPPAAAVSEEERRVEYELRCDESVPAGPRSAHGYALYYVCEDVNGVCLYRRQDFRVGFKVR